MLSTLVILGILTPIHSKNSLQVKRSGIASIEKFKTDKTHML